MLPFTNFITGILICKGLLFLVNISVAEFVVKLRCNKFYGELHAACDYAVCITVGFLRVHFLRQQKGFHESRFMLRKCDILKVAIK